MAERILQRLWVGRGIGHALGKPVFETRGKDSCRALSEVAEESLTMQIVGANCAISPDRIFLVVCIS